MSYLCGFWRLANAYINIPKERRESAMKEIYTPAEIEIITFEAEDVITTSCPVDCQWEGEEGG